jgi:ABC-2 type transport system permease protein
MRWYAVFVKSIREQVREYWILVLTILLAPLFIAIYYLMAETEDPEYDVILVNHDREAVMSGEALCLGDSIVSYAKILSGFEDMFNIATRESREDAIYDLRNRKADVVVVLPPDLSAAVAASGDSVPRASRIELVGDVTHMEYIIGAIWSEELINRYILEVAEIQLPVSWSETTLGFSGARTYFELYVPGLLILAIIMIIFSASSAMVRESETRTLERIRISRLSTLELLFGISLVQILVALLSLFLAIATAIALGYSLIPGTLGFLLLISFLTALSMISFSLLVAAMCRSVKEVAIIGTFPLLLLMFFTGAAFPVSGGQLFNIGSYQVMLNDLLSPKFAIEALNKVLIRGLEMRDTLPEIIALVVLTGFYFITGTWAYRRRHMRAR